jgi:hypothetical protein
MPDPAPTSPRRWVRVCLAALALVVLALMALAIAAPDLACYFARSRLPLTVSPEVAVETLGTASAPAAQPPQAQLAVSPDRARNLAMAIGGHWLPPFLLRSGQYVGGTWRPAELRPHVFTWQTLIVTAAEPPMLSVRLRAAELNVMLVRLARCPILVGDKLVAECGYQIHEAHLQDDDAPDQTPLTRRLRFTARGLVLLDALQERWRFRVDRLEGRIQAGFTSTPNGLRPACALTFDTIQAEPLSLPLVGDISVLVVKQFEEQINRAWSQGLAEVRLPAWAPTDIRIEAEVVP